MKFHSPKDLIKDAAIALELLKEGNRRFTENNLLEKNTHAEDRNTLSEGQQPFAVIITCSDSRVSPEIYFDQKLGDLFVIRNAGNVVDETVLGSIEYAVEHLLSPLVVVVGHSSCGAVTAAIEGGELPKNIKTITDRIIISHKEGDSVEKLAKSHVCTMVEQIKNDIIIEEFKSTVVGAYYNINSGIVEWI